MPLVVIAGLPRDGAAGQLRDAVTQAAREGRRALLAVPGDAEALLARALLAEISPVGVRVATLEGVVEAEWALTGDGRRLARGLGRDVLLARALVSSGVSECPGHGAVSTLGSLVERAGEQALPSTGTDLVDRLVTAVAHARNALTAHGMVERGDVCALLAATAPPADVIAVDGFVDLPPEFETLLTGWAAKGAEVLISVPWLPDLPGTAATTALMDRLVSAGATPQMAGPAEAEPSVELERIRCELFTGGPTAPGAGAVALGIAEGEEAEARYIAAVAARLIDDGADPERVIVAFADVRRHAAWIRRALDDVGVHADVEASVAVGETPFGRMLLDLRGYTLTGSDRGEVAALLRSPFSGATVDDADAADAAWRRAGDTPGSSLGGHARPLRPLLDEARELRDAPIGALVAQRWKKLADAVLANGYPGPAPVAAEDARLDAAVHRAFCRALQEAVELGEGTVSAGELWEHVARRRVMPATLRRPGRVTVTGIDAVAALACDHLIVGGLTAGEFPRRGSEDRLEGDSIERAMLRLGIEGEAGRHACEERRAFYLAAAAANTSITLVRRGSNDEGAPLRESVFWDEFLDLYRRPGEALSTDASPLVTVVPSSAAGALGSRRVTRGKVGGAEALAELGTIAEVSPSEVEAYLSCPYKWFVERKLRAQAPDRTVDVAAAGRLAHEALARFYREWGAAGERRVTRETRERAVRAATAVARDVVAGAGTPGSLEVLTMLESIAPAVGALAGRDADFLPEFAPARLEWAFGRSSEAPAVDLGGVSLVGRADRIDVGPQGLVIVDYKRTHASPLAQVRREGLVQLQLYAAAASRALDLPVAGGLYRSLKDGSDRGFVLEGVAGAFNANDVIGREDLDELVEDAVRTAVGVADRMRSGDVAPTPSTTGCRFCSAAPFCPQAMSG